MSAPPTGVRVVVDGPVATITLDRPDKRNAQTPLTWTALAEAGRELPDEVRVVVLTATGPSFCAGLDRAMLSPEGIAGVPSFASVLQISDAHAEAAVAEFQEGFTWWRRPDLITIAAVHGHAVGAGFQLALACDLRVCAEDAQFSMRETSLGLVPDLAGAKVLVDLVGYSRALEICTTGRWVQAQEAHQLGIATVVVPSGDLDASVRDLVDALVTAPAEAVRATKQLLLAAQEQSYDDNRALAARLQITRLRALLALPRD